jgi:hypothetical protein
MLPVRSRGSVLAVLACLAIAAARCAAPPPREAPEDRAVRNYLKPSSASGGSLVLADGSTVTGFEIMTITPDSESLMPGELSQAFERSRAETEALKKQLLQPAQKPQPLPTPLQQQFAGLAQHELELSAKCATIDRGLAAGDSASGPRVEITRERLRVDVQVKGRDGAVVKKDLSMDLARVNRADSQSLPGEWVVENSREVTHGAAKDSGSSTPAAGLASLVTFVGEMIGAPATFSAPQSMVVDSTNAASLTIGPIATSADEMASVLRAVAGADAPAESAGVKVAPRLEATLSGQVFAINEVTPAKILVNPHAKTEWQWQVTPTDGGVMHLRVSLVAPAVLGGTETPYLVRSFDQTVTVRMTASHWIRAFLAEYWQWVVVALAFPLFVWRWSRRRRAQPR